VVHLQYFNNIYCTNILSEFSSTVVNFVRKREIHLNRRVFRLIPLLCKYKDAFSTALTPGYKPEHLTRRFADISEMVRFMHGELNIPWESDDFSHVRWTREIQLMELGLQLGCPTSENTMMDAVQDVARFRDQGSNAAESVVV
jgi:hypothetical protein